MTEDDSDTESQSTGTRRAETVLGSLVGSSTTSTVSLPKDESSLAYSLPWIKEDRTFISVSSLLNTPSRKFIPSKPTRRDIPFIPPASIQHIERAAFEPFMKEIGDDYLKFEKNKTVIYRQNINGKPPTGIWNRVPDIESVPKVFFEENFDLGNPRIFSLVTGSSADGENAASEQIVQEKLSNYLDIVEANLVKEVSERSVQFFAALSNLKGLEQEAKGCIKSTQQLKQRLKAIEEMTADKGLRRLRLQEKRESLVKLWRSVQAVGEMSSAHSTIQVLLRQEDYHGALDLIDETRAIFNGRRNRTAAGEDSHVAKMDLRRIKVLENLPTKLDETTKLIGKLLEQDFVNVLEADLREADTNNRLVQTSGLDAADFDIQKAVVFTDYTSTISQEDLGESRDRLMHILRGLARVGRIKVTIESFRDTMLKAVRSLVRAYLPMADTQDENDGQSASDKAIALARNLKGMSHDEFNGLMTRTTTALINTLTRISVHVEFMKSSTGSLTNALPIEGDGQESSSQSTAYISEELDDALVSAVDLANQRCSKIVAVRSEQHAKLEYKDFCDMYAVLLRFVVLCERITHKPVVGLRGTVLTQAKSWLASSHGRWLAKSADSISTESWTQIDLKAVDAELVSRLISSATENVSFPSLESSTPQVQEAPSSSTGGQKQIVIDGHSFFVVSATLQALYLTSGYLQVLFYMPSMISEVMNRLLEFLKQYNSRTCQVVLGAGALRSAGLKNITAKHLALASQSLSIVIALLPYMRETMRRFLNQKQAIVLTEFDRLKRDYQDHQNEIHGKLVAIMSDRMNSHCRSLLAQDWALPENDDRVSPYMEALVKETVLLHKVLSKYLPTQTLEFILHQVFAVLKNRLMETYTDVELRTPSGKVRMLNDSRYFREKLSDLKGVSGPGSTVEAIVGEKSVARPERIVDLTPTSKKTAVPSSDELRTSMDQLRKSSFESRRQSPATPREMIEKPGQSATPPFTTLTANGSTVDLIVEAPKQEGLKDTEGPPKQSLIFDAEVDNVREGESDAAPVPPAKTPEQVSTQESIN